MRRLAKLVCLLIAVTLVGSGSTSLAPPEGVNRPSLTQGSTLETIKKKAEEAATHRKVGGLIASSNRNVPWQTCLSLSRIFHTAAQEYGVDVFLLMAVAFHESRFNANARSRTNDYGIMQLNLRTARALGVSNVFDPVENIRAGAKYLRLQLDRFGGDTTKAVAAYNCGPSRVSRGAVPSRSLRYASKVLKTREVFRRSLR